jgi:5-methylthioadenosine/S-adenosylhomocysteine deaminase
MLKTPPRAGFFLARTLGMLEANMETVIEPGWILPVEPEGVVLTQSGVAVKDGRIEAILPVAQLAASYGDAKRIQLPNHLLIPGLINLHTHAAMTLMRGLADDLELMTWLKEHIWPVEMAHVSAGFVYDGTLLACAEMLRGGITCFNDMYFFPEAAARAALDAKIRAVLGMIAIEFPSAYAGDPEDYLHRGLATRDEFRSEPMLGFSLAPHAPYTASDKTLSRIAIYAEKLDLPIHIHLHETLAEIEGSVEQHHMRPIARLHRLGLLGPNLIAVHAVHLKPEEILLLKEQGCSVAHCPTSNLKLASGFAPVAEMLAVGINVGLGTDGAASNNRLDLFAELRLAALLAKGVAGSAQALPAHDALSMATIRSAKALGLDAQIGSLKPGKAADIVAVDLSALETTPCYDVVSHLAYAAGREHVTHVWINGELLLEERRLRFLDGEHLASTARLWHEKISAAKH